MRIEVFGPGCAKCVKTAKNAQEAVTQLGIDAEVIKVEKVEEIMNRGIMLTPAVCIDGQKFSEGKVAQTDQIKGWIQSRLKEGNNA